MEQMALFSNFQAEKNKIIDYHPNLFMHKGLRIEVLRKPFYFKMDLSINDQGKVKLRCAKCTCVQKIRDFVDKHIIWINKTLKQRLSIRKKHPKKRLKTGEKFLFLGKNLILDYQKSSQSGFCLNKEHLVYQYSHLEHLSKPIIREYLIKFYHKQASSFFHKIVNKWAQRMVVCPKLISIRSQKTLWGSCSQRACISLNFRLIGAPFEVLEYVIIHELSHLKYPNHSKAFWSYVSKWDLNYKDKEKWLKEKSYCLDFLSPLTNP